MTPREQENILEDVLGGDDSAPLREATLSAGLNALHWKRRKRIAARASLLILPLAILLFPTHHQKKLLSQIQPAAAVAPKVEQITTEELFALFPNRPLALVGKPGAQQLVFLDQPQRVQ
jgi:hypothetical protein